MVSFIIEDALTRFLKRLLEPENTPPDQQTTAQVTHVQPPQQVVRNASPAPVQQGNTQISSSTPTSSTSDLGRTTPTPTGTRVLQPEVSPVAQKFMQCVLEGNTDEVRNILVNNANLVHILSFLEFLVWYL